MDARALRKARKAVVEQRAQDREARGRNKKHISVFRKLRRRVGAALIETLAPWILRGLSKTWRVEFHGAAGCALMRSDRAFICVSWHGRMLTLMPVEGHCDRGLSVLVSPSADGNLAKRALSKLSYKVFRGSLSRRGARAMREMHEAITQGAQMVITPDGPRGPRHSINIGPAWLARATGAPIVSVGVAVDKAWRLKSWDRMTIPKPFARLRVTYGEPVEVQADLTDEQLEELSAALRVEMITREREAYAAIGVPNDLEEGDDDGSQRGNRQADTSSEA